MGRTATPTLLPIDRWAALIGINPLHFNQVTSTASPVNVCGMPWFQYPYQAADRVGREDVALAIKQAEDAIAAVVGYELLPRWEIDEWAPTTRPARRELYNVSLRNVRGQISSVQARYGYIISGGIQAKTVIQAGAAVTYSDQDGDGYNERAQVSVATTITDPNEIAIFFPGEGGADEWEIRPITVTIAGGTATIRFRREQLVDPDLWERLDADEVDGALVANFLTTVDVYRRYNDPQQQVQLLWEPTPVELCCSDATCTACNWSTQFGCLLTRDNRLGIVTYRPGTWSADTEEFSEDEPVVGRLPDKLRLWYFAGWRDQRRARPLRDMDPYWEAAVAYYAASLLDRPICSCDTVTAFIQRWSTDLTREVPDGQRFQIGTASRANKVLDNPLGTTAGAVYAWNRCSAEGRTLGRGI